MTVNATLEDILQAFVPYLEQNNGISTSGAQYIITLIHDLRSYGLSDDAVMNMLKWFGEYENYSASFLRKLMMDMFFATNLTIRPEVFLPESLVTMYAGYLSGDYQPKSPFAEPLFRYLLKEEAHVKQLFSHMQVMRSTLDHQKPDIIGADAEFIWNFVENKPVWAPKTLSDPIVYASDRKLWNQATKIWKDLLIGYMHFMEVDPSQIGNSTGEFLRNRKNIARVAQCFRDGREMASELVHSQCVMDTEMLVLIFQLIASSRALKCLYFVDKILKSRKSVETDLRRSVYIHYYDLDKSMPKRCDTAAVAAKYNIDESRVKQIVKRGDSRIRAYVREHGISALTPDKGLGMLLSRLLRASKKGL